MNKKIAISIVLLLPDEFNQMICSLSSKIIPPKGLKPYVLDNKKYLPHITLLMGTITEDKIRLIKKKIEIISKKYLPIKINLINLKNNSFPSLDIQQTQELVDFQNEIAREIILDYDATKEMFVDSDISDLGVEWINKFKENNLSAGKFNIHLTLGSGDASYLEINLPIEVNINTIAISQIGYGCSCRKVLENITF